MDNAQRLKILSNTGKTAFSLKNLQSLWGSPPQITKIIAKRMVDKGLIARVDRGYYALNENFNIYELANLIISPSYVSLHSSLFYHGIAFQVSNIITSVSLLNYQREVGGRVYEYHAMKASLFFTMEGIDYKGNVSMAKPERAILDCLYFNILPNIDNMDKINPTYLRGTSLFYPGRVQEKLKNILSDYDQKRI
ncbi:MAG TPA: hypothetical protein DDW17_02465 [Deltaproteobacteria bacterium]|nr:hypothetical protein [Deltaproteobacteria bacterium]